MINNTSGKKDLISIIIPTFNRGSLIGETIESFLKQDYRPIELIIIDDGSTDNTEEVVLAYSDNLSQGVSLIYEKNNKKGACAARNIGTAISTGEFIQYFDSDDIVCPDFFVKRVDILKQNDSVDIVACNFLFYDEHMSGKKGEKKVDNIPHTIQSHLFYSAFPTPIFLSRRTAIEKMGKWDEDCLRLQDMRYFNRIFLYNLNTVWLPDFLFMVRQHSNAISATNTDGKYLSSMIQVFYSICEEWKEDRRVGLVKDISVLLITSLLLRLISFKEYKVFIIEAFRMFRRFPGTTFKSFFYQFLRIIKLNKNYIRKKLVKV